VYSCRKTVGPIVEREVSIYKEIRKTLKCKYLRYQERSQNAE
jgi:hypothetical protein